MRPKRILVKLGGASLNQGHTLQELAQFCHLAQGEGHELIIVHGGGPAINAELTARGINWAFIDGQRQTTPEMAKVIEEVLYEKVNLEVARTLQSQGLKLTRFSGAQDRVLQCVSENPLLIQVGKIVDVDSSLIECALKNGAIPVVAPLGFSMNPQGEITIYNINADWAAVKLAVALDATDLYFLTDQIGILDASKAQVNQMTTNEALELIDSGVINGGMMTKVRSMLFAIENGVESAKIGNAQSASDLLTGKVSGSTIVPNTLCAQAISPRAINGEAYGTFI